MKLNSRKGKVDRWHVAPRLLLAGLLAALPTGGCASSILNVALAEWENDEIREFRAPEGTWRVLQADGFITGEIIVDGARFTRLVFRGLLAGDDERTLEVLIPKEEIDGPNEAHVREIRVTGIHGAIARIFVSLPRGPPTLPAMLGGTAAPPGHVLSLKVYSTEYGA